MVRPASGAGRRLLRNGEEGPWVRILGQLYWHVKCSPGDAYAEGFIGPRTLCNACGLVYAKLVRVRLRFKLSNINHQTLVLD